MTSKSIIKRMKAQMALYTPSDENMDTMIIGAIMEELCGAKPEGTAEEMEARQHRKTGYVFPKSPQIKSMMEAPAPEEHEQPESLLKEIDEHTAACDQLIDHYKRMH